MKTLTNLDAFKLDKKQMNKVDGGKDDQACKELQAIPGSPEAAHMTDADWDAWANRFEEWCV